MREWLRRSNGWQRAWIVLAGISLFGHLTGLVIVVADLRSSMDRRDAARIDVERAEAFFARHGADCSALKAELQRAEAAYREQRGVALRELTVKRTRLLFEQQDLQKALDAAEARLDSFNALKLQN